MHLLNAHSLTISHSALSLCERYCDPTRTKTKIGFCVTHVSVWSTAISRKNAIHSDDALSLQLFTDNSFFIIIFFAHLISFSWVSNHRRNPCRDRTRKWDVALYEPSRDEIRFTSVYLYFFLFSISFWFTSTFLIRQQCDFWPVTLRSNLRYAW